MKRLEQPAPVTVTVEQRPMRTYASIIQTKVAKAATPVEVSKCRVTVAVYRVKAEVKTSEETKTYSRLRSILQA